MSDSSAAIGLASASSGWPPPNSSACGLEMNDQVTASTRPRAASARLALRVRTCAGVSTGLRGASPRSNGVDGTRSTPTMRTISSTRSALPSMSGRHDGGATFTRSPWPATKKPSLVSTRRISGRSSSRPASRFTSVGGKSMIFSGRFGLAGDDDLGRRAAAEVEHHLRREFEAGQHEVRIDAALEAIARVGVDAELAAGLRDVERVPQRRLDQHVGGALVAARGLAAHDAGERLDAVVVGDHAHGVVERVGLAVERQQRLAVLGAAHDEIALHLRGVEHVQRPAAVVGDEVGDVDQRVDRAQADRRQPLLQPVRRRAVLDAAHQAQREGRAERRRRAEVERHRRPGRGTCPSTGFGVFSL